MRIRKTITKALPLITLVTVIGMAVVWINWDSVRASSVGRSRADSGLVGVTPGQAVRYNIVNTGDERGIIIIGGKFTDSEGNTLAEFAGRKLALGQGMSFDLHRAAISRDGSRVEVNAAITFIGHPDNLQGSTQVVNIDTGQSVMGWLNHNETLMRDTAHRRPVCSSESGVRRDWKLRP